MIKVLLVDDDIDLLEMVCLMLNTHQMDAECISQGENVLTCLQANKPDILVMDIYLGKEDGRILCRDIKNSGKYSTLPVLLYSAGNVSSTSISECGADDFIQKPFDMSLLINRIKSLVNS